MQATFSSPTAFLPRTAAPACSKPFAVPELASQRFAKRAILKENHSMGASPSELRQANRQEPGFWGTLNRMANAMLVIDLFELIAGVGSAAFGWLHHFF